jgi:hypothetical protein
MEFDRRLIVKVPAHSFYRMVFFVKDWVTITTNTWRLTLSNPIFLPTAYSPALICFGRWRGCWITCNYPTVLKEKTKRNRKEYNLRYLLAKVHTTLGKASDRLRQRANKRNKNRLGCLPTSDQNWKIILSDEVRCRIGNGYQNSYITYWDLILVTFWGSQMKQQKWHRLPFNMDVSFKVGSEFLVLENILLMEMNSSKNLGVDINSSLLIEGFHLRVCWHICW